MRFAIAFVTLLVAALLVAAGVAERTVLKPADAVSTTFTVPAGAHYVVIPGSVLRAHAGQQRLRLSGSTVAFAAYGKAADVTAWLSGERYAQLAVTSAGQPAAAVVRTAPTVAGLPAGGSPDPDGSDLWLDQRTGRGGLDWPINVPASVSVLVAADGASAAPSTVQLTWPLPTATPYALPLILGGAVVAVFGLLLYVWALVHMRRRRGPRRKAPPKMPKRPQPPKYRPAKAPVVTSARGRRSVVRFAARPTAALGLLVSGAVALTGCSLHAAAAATTSTAAPTATVVQAVVSEGQAQRIVHEVAVVAAKADAKRDAGLLADRFIGPALELRQAAYLIRKKDKKADLPQAVPDPAVLRLILPERTDTWPRTLFAVATDSSSAKVPPLALALVQNDPRSDYKVEYAMSLQPNAKLPDVPSATLGASRLAADTQVLRAAPDTIAADYGVLLRKPNAAPAQIFDVASDDLVGSVGAKAKAKAVKALGDTAKITFSTLPSTADVVALSTADAGALVAVDLDEQWTVKPKKAGVTVTPSGGTKILSGTASTQTGIASVYGYQLLFSVPSAGSNEPVVLLGYAQGLVSAKEL